MTPHQKDDLDRHITGNWGWDQESAEEGHCRMCSALLDDDGTEEEERAHADGLCMDCYQPGSDPDQEYDRRRDEEMVSE